MIVHKHAELKAGLTTAVVNTYSVGQPSITFNTTAFSQRPSSPLNAWVYFVLNCRGCSMWCCDGHFLQTETRRWHPKILSFPPGIGNVWHLTSIFSKGRQHFGFSKGAVMSKHSPRCAAYHSDARYIFSSLKSRLSHGSQLFSITECILKRSIY